MDITHRHDSTVRQINDVLCYFGKLDFSVKLNLLYSFCSSFYGCELWNLRCDKLDRIYVSWRRALKNIWKLPMNTHTNIVYALCGRRTVETEIMLRTLHFSLRCINSDNNIVRYIARHAAFVLRTKSGFGFNFSYCCHRFQVVVPITNYYDDLNYDSVFRDIKRHLNPPVVENLTFIFELIMLRDNTFELSSSCLDKFDLTLILNHLCTF